MSAPCAVAKVTQVDHVVFLQELAPHPRTVVPPHPRTVVPMLFVLLDVRKVCLGAMLGSVQCRRVVMSIYFLARGMQAEMWMFDLEVGLEAARPR